MAGDHLSKIRNNELNKYQIKLNNMNIDVNINRILQTNGTLLCVGWDREFPPCYVAQIKNRTVPRVRVCFLGGGKEMCMAQKSTGWTECQKTFEVVRIGAFLLFTRSLPPPLGRLPPSLLVLGSAFGVRESVAARHVILQTNQPP